MCVGGVFVCVGVFAVWRVGGGVRLCARVWSVCAGASHPRVADFVCDDRQLAPNLRRLQLVEVHIELGCPHLTEVIRVINAIRDD